MASKVQGDPHALPMSFHELPNRPPTHRSVKVYGTSTAVLKTMINTGLSLNISNTSLNPNTNLEQTERITGIINTPNTNLNKQEEL